MIEKPFRDIGRRTYNIQWETLVIKHHRQFAPHYVKKTDMSVLRFTQIQLNTFEQICSVFLSEKRDHELFHYFFQRFHIFQASYNYDVSFSIEKMNLEWGWANAAKSSRAEGGWLSECLLSRGTVTTAPILAGRKLRFPREGKGKSQPLCAHVYGWLYPLVLEPLPTPPAPLLCREGSHSPAGPAVFRRSHFQG